MPGLHAENQMSIFRTLLVIPYMVVPAAFYYAMHEAGRLDLEFGGIALPSGGQTYFFGSDIVLMVGLFCLMVEIIKSTASGMKGSVDFVLSALLMIVGISLYLLLPGFGTFPFLVIVTLQVIDVLTGIVIMIAAARRDVSIAT